MQAELPLEVVLTHTRGEVEGAVAALPAEPAGVLFKGRNWQLSRDTMPQDQLQSSRKNRQQGIMPEQVYIRLFSVVGPLNDALMKLQKVALEQKISQF